MHLPPNTVSFIIKYILSNQRKHFYNFRIYLTLIPRLFSYELNYFFSPERALFICFCSMAQGQHERE